METPFGIGEKFYATFEKLQYDKLAQTVDTHDIQIFEFRTECYTSGLSGFYVVGKTDDGTIGYFPIDSLGKTLFSTEEEAKEKLNDLLQPFRIDDDVYVVCFASVNGNQVFITHKMKVVGFQVINGDYCVRMFYNGAFYNYKIEESLGDSIFFTQKEADMRIKELKCDNRFVDQIFD